MSLETLKEKFVEMSGNEEIRSTPFPLLDALYTELIEPLEDKLYDLERRLNRLDGGNEDE